jgi:predicted nucleic acid-binding protein
MLHVFVETNWIVDIAAPEHRRLPAARELLDRARSGEFELHLPALCISEARRAILHRFQPRGEADAIRRYVQWASAEGKVSKSDAGVVFAALDNFESKVRGELSNLGQTLDGFRKEKSLEVFPLDEPKLQLSLDLSFQVDLTHFDHAVLSGVLGRAAELEKKEGTAAHFAFCEKDGDLRPWDKHGRSRQPLADLYDARHIRVFGDYDVPPAASW